jgi:transcriptional regulator with XRE-family HTH domain
VDDRVLSQLDIDQQIDRIRPEPSVRAHQPSISNFSTLLEQMREARNLTKADLAKKAGVDPSTITRFEQGARAPERATILQLAEAMVLPMADRDRLLASAGFRSEIWDDPLLVELAQFLQEPGIPLPARQEARSVVRMAIAYLKLQRLQDS